MKDAKGHGSNGTGAGSNFHKYWNGSLSQSVANDIAAGRSKTLVAGGQPVSSNAEAAQSLMSGLKSTQAPVHDAWSETPGGDREPSHDYGASKGTGPTTRPSNPHPDSPAGRAAAKHEGNMADREW